MDKALKTQYTDFLKKYQSLGHISEVNDEQEDQKISYYLPRHGVSKEESSTTKLREVFDASAKTDTGLSLNDVLKVGPTIQDDIFFILLRCRKHKFVL